MDHHQFNHGQQEPDDDMGNSESYQCVFCKRGFTNAQALGGHMNIHRRDRARMSNSTTSTSNAAHKHHQNHFLNHVPSISSNQNREICGFLRPGSLADDSRTTRNYCHTYFPAPPLQLSSMSNNKHYHQQHYQQQQQQPLSLFQQEDRSYTGLELQIGHPSMYIEEMKTKDEEEIDLELRLGHDN